MRIAEGALLGDGGLRPLLKTASVGHASKNTRNELGIIYQAEPEEQLVFLVKVDVHPGIERVAVFKQLW